MKKKIVHLIPQDAPGGVEIGAKLAQQEFKNNINYEIRFIWNKGDNIIVKFIKSLKATKLLFKEIKGKENHVILSSLWFLLI